MSLLRKAQKHKIMREHVAHIVRIAENLCIIDLALYFEKERVLVIADTHIGYEEALNKAGILVPRTQFTDLIFRLKEILKICYKLDTKTRTAGKLAKIIINGDVKHDFNRISTQEWNDTLQLLNLLLEHSEEVVLVKGNHDAIIEPIARKKGVLVTDYAIVDGVLILHGHVIPKHIAKIVKSAKINTILLGHEHPAISIGQKKEKYKCFLRGKWTVLGKKLGFIKLTKQKPVALIVMPSFFLAWPGTDIRNEKLLSPFLKMKKGVARSIADFKVFVVENLEGKISEPGKVLYFGKIGSFLE